MTIDLRDVSLIGIDRDDSRPSPRGRERIRPPICPDVDNRVSNANFAHEGPPSLSLYADAPKPGVYPKDVATEARLFTARKCDGEDCISH
jgi:hypothetical protein